MRISRAAAVLSLAATGCGGGGGSGGAEETGRVEVTLIVPPSGNPAQDPFAGAVAFHLEILDDSGAVLVEEDFDADDPLELRALQPGNRRVVLLEAVDDGGAVISRGRTIPIDIVEGPTPVQTTLYFARVNAFADVYGSPADRRGAATWAFSDGRVLIAGGLDGGGSALATTEIFDWQNDTILPGGSMSSAHAFPAIAPLGNDTVLIAGGVSAAAGTPTAAADVYTHTTDGIGVWATGVPDMPAARREHVAVELGTGRALVAGGSSMAAAGGPPLQSTLLFQWNGSSGSFTTGPQMDAPRMGAIAMAASGDIAIIAGGYDGAFGGPASTDFARDIDVFEWTGSAVAKTGGGNLTNRRGWAGAAEVGADQWLVWGGERDSGGHQLIALVELWTWNGMTLSEQARMDLPSPQRGGAGGKLGGNRVLLLGGNTAGYPGETAAPTATIYDAAADGYTPLSSPGATLGGAVVPLPDGTFLVVTDGAVLRYNP